MDIYQARTASTQEEVKAKIHIHQEKIGGLNTLQRVQVRGSHQHQVEDVSQKTQGLSKELNEKIDETQVDPQLRVMTSIDKLSRSLEDDKTDTKKDCQKVHIGTRGSTFTKNSASCSTSRNGQRRT
jgi:hypothetical protein